MGWVVNATSRPLYPEKDPVPIVGWANTEHYLGEEEDRYSWGDVKVISNLEGLVVGKRIKLE